MVVGNFEKYVEGQTTRDHDEHHNKARLADCLRHLKEHHHKYSHHIEAAKDVKNPADVDRRDC